MAIRRDDRSRYIPSLSSQPTLTAQSLMNRWGHRANADDKVGYRPRRGRRLDFYLNGVAHRADRLAGVAWIGIASRTDLSEVEGIGGL